MTLGQIMTLALRQLDEDPQDISEHDELFRLYANTGYKLAVQEYVKPRDVREVRSDKEGRIWLDSDIRRVASLKRKKDNRDVVFMLTPDASALKVDGKEERYEAICEIKCDEMEKDTDEPTYLPEEAHDALVDYVCFRHLSNGNMAKQSRAQFYQGQFFQAMQRLRPQGFGSVTAYKNLYAASDIRWTR